MQASSEQLGTKSGSALAHTMRRNGTRLWEPFVYLGFLPGGVLQNRYRTLRELGPSFRARGQLEFVDTALERRGLCRYN